MADSTGIPWHRSIRFRLVAVAVVVELCMLAVLLVNSFRLINTTLESETRARMEALAPLLGTTLAGYVFERNHVEIESVLKRLAASRQTDIRYLAVYDSRGQLLASAGTLPAEARLDTSLAGALLDLTYDTEVKLSLANTEVGSVRYGLAINRMVALRDNVVQQGLLIAAIAILLTVLLLASSGWFITKNIASLLAATRRIAHGDHAYRIAVSGSDEISRLAADFNAMAEAIEERMRFAQASETRLRAANEEQETLIENVLIGILITADGLIARCNREFLNTMGYATMDDLLGKPALMFFSSAEDYCRFGDAVRPALAGGGTVEVEWPLMRRDGSQCWMRIAAKPVQGQGAGYRTVWLMADISSHRKAQESLRLAASVFAHADEGIMITDRDGTIIDVNAAFTRITGYAREEALDHKASILASGRHDARFYAEMWEDIGMTGYWHGEVWNRRKNGEVYAELLTISALRDAAGAVQQYVGLFSDISEIKEHQVRLERLAHFDALTQLPNRVLLVDRLRQAISQSSRSQKILAVAYLDLDEFKAINDTFGHEAGDRLLVEAARRFSQCMRTGDTVSRMGGDEFVLIVSSLNTVDECNQVFGRILEAIALPCEIDGRQMTISASIGITLYPFDESDAETLMRHADQAMYTAKQLGRNRFHLFDAEHDRLVQAVHEVRSRIEEGLARREFVLHYQPKVNMRTGQVIGVEALVRWEHSQRGILLPADFLPPIEDSALAATLGEWVVETAVAQLDAWRKAGLGLTMSINIAARHLQSEGFADRLGQLLQRYPGVPADAVELEVLETAALEDMSAVSGIIAACHQLGVRFALDDFGTGYSSLSYFRRLRVDVLKIDQSFVRDLLTDAEDYAIIEGVIALTHSFHRQVVAEGVETAEIGLALLDMGCDLAQGHGIARPMPAAAIPEWVAGYRPDPLWAKRDEALAKSLLTGGS